MTPKLCLGTAQFGFHYGITNTAGQVPEGEVARLLLEIEKADFRWLDTAQAYGNAEEVLGRHLPDIFRSSIISKFPAQSKMVFTSEDVNTWEAMFHLSLERLGVASLNALLLHSPSDLSKAGGNYLEDWLVGLRQRGLVKRIGISIYTADDLVGVNLKLLDIVQFPLSLFDQRLLADGTLHRLSAQGIALHARSLYLQGLLVTPTQHWPSGTNDILRDHQESLESLAKERRCKLIDLALGFAKQQPDLEAVVLGVCNTTQLHELRESWLAHSPWRESEWRSWAIEDPKIIDPRYWVQH